MEGNQLLYPKTVMQVLIQSAVPWMHCYVKAIDNCLDSNELVGAVFIDLEQSL